jgi:hypothetical protein
VLFVPVKHLAEIVEGGLIPLSRGEKFYLQLAVGFAFKELLHLRVPGLEHSAGISRVQAFDVENKMFGSDNLAGVGAGENGREQQEETENITPVKSHGNMLKDASTLRQSALRQRFEVALPLR